VARKVVQLTFAGIDGVVETPTWAAPFLNDELVAASRHTYSLRATRRSPPRT
jgi:hypothetical protein